ncbi:MAG: YhcH/YjgK/YiaL family protein [Acetivibrionales bacterium]|jgi:biofilm protein TabA
MIYDKLDHIETYKGLSEDLYLGLEFLKNTTPDIENGVHEINPRVKAIVSEYETKKANENGYEAHKKYIDIQYVLQGAEKVCCLPIEHLQLTTPYKEEIDAAFYSAYTQPVEMTIGEGCFAVFFPQDGHMPCLSINEPIKVKKVVVKVEVF